MNRVSILAVAAALATSSAQAATIPLADLLTPGSTLTLGDKTWGDFGFSTTCTDFTARDINVSPMLQGGVYYLVFQGPLHAIAGETCDTKLQYSVNAAAPNVITMIDQAFTLSGGANSTLQIGETVWANGFFSGAVAQSTVSYNAAVPGVPLIDFEDPPGELLEGDQLLVPSLSKVWVTKDILLHAGPNEAVSATIIAQSFHQSVPDGGATLALLGLALTAIIGYRRF